MKRRRIKESLSTMRQGGSAVLMETIDQTRVFSLGAGPRMKSYYYPRTSLPAPRPVAGGHRLPERRAAHRTRIHQHGWT